MEYGLKFPVRYCFQWRKTTVGWLQRAIRKKGYKVQLKSIVLLQNCKIKWKRIIIVLKCKKMVLFEKIDKNFQFNSLFLGIPEMFLSILVRVCVCVCVCVVYDHTPWRVHLSGVGIPGDRSTILRWRRCFPLPSSFIDTLVWITKTF